jgi:diguanylate cyclase (GGDEF)-like protein/putative nucleotidyltransferase with HDIG domain
VADFNKDTTAFSRSAIQLLTLVAGHIGSALTALRGMRSLGSHDLLTGALNRMGLEDTLERTWWMSRRYQFPLGIAVVDLDHFKRVNDSYDHSVGDQVLREFSTLMNSMCRASDVTARYAGDEFVAILPQADEEGIRTFANRLLNTTAEHVFLPQDQRIKLTVSVGVATSLAPIPPVTSDDLLNRADRALLTAKREGRNRTCIWPDQTGVVIPKNETTEDQAPAKEPGQRIMVVDDEKAILAAFKQILKAYDYEVETFSSADDAIARLKSAAEDEFAVILTDLRMPGKDGIQFLHEIRAQSELAVKIIITGFATVDNTVSGLREGVFDIIQKPVRASDLVAAVRRAQEYRRLKIDNVKYREHLEELVLERSAQLASSLEEIRKSHEFTLEAMVAMLDAREDQTARHSIRVRELAVALGERMDFEESDLETLAMAALLHDIGKISVPDAVLLKPGPLLPEEWDIMRKHPETGYQILMTGSYLKEVAELVYAHHERYDGTGYPRGIHGKNIPVGARVFAVIDAYEAMRSERAYRSPLTQEQAVKEIQQNRGTQFDPDIVDMFLKYQPEMERLLTEGEHGAAGGHRHWRASQLRHQTGTPPQE